MGNCDVDEILKQLKVLDSLKQLRENMGEGNFMAKWPELSGLNSRIDSEIASQEEELQSKMSECGAINTDELPAEVEETPQILGDLPELEIPET
jgi:hypothetical protein